MSNSVPDLTGRKIGEYEIVARIGLGGMGAVYEGRQPLIGKRVAVKVLLPALSNEKELVDRFLSEARAVNEIRHRGIVDIFSFGQLPEGSCYFVMEYLEGEGFERIIKQRAPLPLAEALKWTEEILDALDSAHHAGIIHRDVKPSNLFLVKAARGKPYVKLLDFGIAKLGAVLGESTPQTRASVIMGTPDYISPEQARGKSISPQTDLYAVGCVLFELVTGQRLFRSENSLATMWAHVEDPPPLPSSLRPEIPPALDEIILWSLEKKGESRPPSAEAMRDVLEQVRHALGPNQALTPSPLSGERVLPHHTPPPSVRNRVMAGTPSPSGYGLQTLGTPAPLLGSEPTVSGKRPHPRPSMSPVRPSTSGETRLAPLEALSRSEERPAVSRSASELPPPPPPDTTLSGTATPALGADLPEPTQETTSPERMAYSKAAPSRLPLVLAALVGLLVLGLVAHFALSGPAVEEEPPPPPPTPVSQVKPLVPPRPPVAVQPPTVEPTLPTKPPALVPEPQAPKPKPVTVVTPVVKPEPTVKPEPVGKPEATVKPEPVEKPELTPRPKTEPPKPKGVTTAQLQARLARLEQKLNARETQTGEKDRVLRQFLEQASKKIASASTDGERKEAAKFLDEVQEQF